MLQGTTVLCAADVVDLLIPFGIQYESVIDSYSIFSHPRKVYASSRMHMLSFPYLNSMERDID